MLWLKTGTLEGTDFNFKKFKFIERNQWNILIDDVIDIN